jgi:hypothetical protein
VAEVEDRGTSKYRATMAVLAEGVVNIVGLVELASRAKVIMVGLEMEI